MYLSEQTGVGQYLLGQLRAIQRNENFLHHDVWQPPGVKTLTIAARLLRPNHQYRIRSMAHHDFGDAAEHPTLHARTAVRTHGDQTAWSLVGRVDNFIAGKSLFGQT